MSLIGMRYFISLLRIHPHHIPHLHRILPLHSYSLHGHLNLYHDDRRDDGYDYRYDGYGYDAHDDRDFGYDDPCDDGDDYRYDGDGYDDVRLDHADDHGGVFVYDGLHDDQSDNNLMNSQVLLLDCPHNSIDQIYWMSIWTSTSGYNQNNPLEDSKSP